LADLLTARGRLVWLDVGQLTVGDRLLRRINDGLSRSRFGVVTLSERCFRKNWPQWGLEGMAAIESAESRKVMCPSCTA
jgi:hypothetical protein